MVFAPHFSIAKNSACRVRFYSRPSHACPPPRCPHLPPYRHTEWSTNSCSSSGTPPTSFRRLPASRKGTATVASGEATVRVVPGRPRQGPSFGAVSRRWPRPVDIDYPLSPSQEEEKAGDGDGSVESAGMGVGGSPYGFSPHLLTPVSEAATVVGHPRSPVHRLFAVATPARGGDLRARAAVDTPPAPPKMRSEPSGSAEERYAAYMEFDHTSRFVGGWGVGGGRLLLYAAP